jgi:hypothetical protein
MNTLALLCLLGFSLGTAPEASSFGAISSAPLPNGSLAVWGIGGYPAVRAGFRQGLSDVEVGAEAGFDFLLAKAHGVGTLRAPLFIQDRLRLSLDLEAGGFVDAGATWSDGQNEPAAGLRFGVGAALTYKTGWPVSLLAFARIPVEVPFNSAGTFVPARIGGGSEVALSREFYLVLIGGLGPDLRNVSRGVSARWAIELMTGLGYRIF